MVSLKNFCYVCKVPRLSFQKKGDEILILKRGDNSLFSLFRFDFSTQLTAFVGLILDL